MRTNITKLIPLLIIITIILSLISGCGSQNASGFNADLARQKLDAALVKSVTDKTGQVNRNAVIYVEAPHQKFLYSGAAGVARADTRETMTTDHQFTIASVGKPMTSVIVLQLWEEGAFGEKGLDATLDELEIFPPEVIEALHNMDGVSYGHEITVRHLLNHTSGLKDYDDDSATGVGDDYPEYNGYAPGSLNHTVVYDEEKGFEAMIRCVEDGLPAGCQPEDYYLSYTWPHWDYDAWVEDPTNKMAGLLNFYLGGANQNSLWKPGENYNYTDTNYLILGLLIEKITGNSLHHELRIRIFDPLGMDQTYMRYATNPPTTTWEGTLSDMWGLDKPLITNKVNLSMDWGGGGQVSTAEDLNTFMRALANGKLFKHPATLTEMLKPANAEFPYGAGITAWPADEGLILHHNGSSGSWIEYHTAHDVSITGTVNEMDPVRLMTLRADINKALTEAGLQSSDLKAGAASIPLMSVAMGNPPTMLLAILGICVLLFLSALIAWPIGVLVNRRKEQSAPSSQRMARWWAIGAIVGNLIFLFAFIFTVMNNPFQLMFGFVPSVRLILLLPWVSIILTVGLLIFTGLAWKDRYWGIIGRIHYTVVALAALGFLWVLYDLQLLGIVIL